MQQQNLPERSVAPDWVIQKYGNGKPLPLVGATTQEAFLRRQSMEREAGIASASSELRGASWFERGRVSFISFITKPAATTGLLVDIFRLGESKFTGRALPQSQVERAQAETIIEARGLQDDFSRAGYVVGPVVSGQSPLSIPLYFAGGGLLGKGIGIAASRAAPYLPTVPLASKVITTVIANPKATQAVVGVVSAGVIAKGASDYDAALQRAGASYDERIAKVSGSVVFGSASFAAGAAGFGKGFSPYAEKVFAPRTRVTEVTGLKIESRTLETDRGFMTVSKTEPVTRSYVVKANEVPPAQLNGKGFYYSESTGKQVFDLGGFKSTRTSYGETSGLISEPKTAFITRTAQSGVVFDAPVKQSILVQGGGRLKLTEIDFEQNLFGASQGLERGVTKAVTTAVWFDQPIRTGMPSVGKAGQALFSTQFAAERPLVRNLKAPQGEITFPKLATGRYIQSSGGAGAGNVLQVEAVALRGGGVPGAQAYSAAGIEKVAFRAPAMAFTGFAQREATVFKESSVFSPQLKETSIALQKSFPAREYRTIFAERSVSGVLPQKRFSLAGAIKPEARQKSGLLPGIRGKTMVGPRFAENPAVRTSSITGPISPTLTRTVNAPAQPTLNPSFSPSFPPFAAFGGALPSGFDARGFSFDYRGRRGKRRYTPDITSIVTGRRAKRAPRGAFGGMFSGLELRPVVR